MKVDCIQSITYTEEIIVYTPRFGDSNEYSFYQYFTSFIVCLFITLSLLKVKPFTNISSEKTSRLILANDSLLAEAIKIGDLSKATEIANTALQAISQDLTLDQRQKTKVCNFELHLYMYRVCSQRPCWRSKTIKIFA